MKKTVRIGTRKSLLALVQTDIVKDALQRAFPETEIEIVSDLFSLEIFVNGISMSNVICPPLGADGLELSISARSCQYTRYEIK